MDLHWSKKIQQGELSETQCFNLCALHSLLKIEFYPILPACIGNAAVHLCQINHYYMDEIQKYPFWPSFFEHYSQQFCQFMMDMQRNLYQKKHVNTFALPFHKTQKFLDIKREVKQLIRHLSLDAKFLFPELKFTPQDLVHLGGCCTGVCSAKIR